MSLAAMMWAIYRAPTESASEAQVLVAMADRADENGRRVAVSVAFVAKATRQSARTVHRRLRELRGRGLIRVAQDQSAVASLPEGRRPVVYELVMTLDRQPGREPLGDPDTLDEITDGELDWHYSEEQWPGPSADSLVDRPPWDHPRNSRSDGGSDCHPGSPAKTQPAVTPVDNP
ncbi:MAG: hypothetical protein LBG11_02850, partial [Bifidobacteriaceae bacterium]|nr:hypothetical protein [Bifidobacteriaceae bacterium]